MNRSLKIIATLSLATLFSGCASITGFDASSDFSCEAQPGVSCKSVSGVYQNAMQKNLPSQRETYGQDFTVIKPAKAITGKAVQTGEPLYQKAVTLRVWLSPWEDKNMVLHDQSYSYLLLQKAKWQVEHFRPEDKQKMTYSIK